MKEWHKHPIAVAMIIAVLGGGGATLWGALTRHWELDRKQGAAIGQNATMAVKNNQDVREINSDVVVLTTQLALAKQRIVALEATVAHLTRQAERFSDWLVRGEPEPAPKRREPPGSLYGPWEPN